MAPKGKKKAKPKGKKPHRKTTASASNPSGDAARVIPSEVTFGILSRLPVKTLLRFKCVSKQWRTLVTLPRFITAHLKRSPASLIIHALRTPLAGETWTHIDDLLKASHAGKKAQAQPDEEKAQLLSDVGHADEETQVLRPDGHVISVYGPPGPQSTIDHILDFPGSDVARFDYLEVIGTPNGIVCISQHQYATKLTLWNPATRFSMPIPPPGIRPDPDLHRVANVGLAFDPAHNDYKVIRITCHYVELSIPDVAEVFSLKSGRWEPVDHPVGDIPFWVTGEKCRAVVGGVPYWVCLTPEAGVGLRPMLLSFDVKKAAFDLEQLEWLTKKKDMCIGEIREGCLGAVVWDGGSEKTENQVIDVWMRDEEGVWTRICQDRELPVVGKVIGFYGDRLGILVEDGDEGNLTMLNLESFKTEDFFNVEGSVPGSFRVVNYRESLSRIPEIGKAIIRTRFDAGGDKISRHDLAKKRIGQRR